MTDGAPAGRERLERELKYYQREYNELGARLLRSQEEQSRVSREARRSKIVARLVREAYQIVNYDIEASAIGEHILATVAETSFCDRAAFLWRPPGNKAPFFVEHAFGLTVGTSVELNEPPDFLYTASGQIVDPVAVELTKFAGLPYLLWAYTPESGRALLLGKRIEGNIHRPFEAGDQELVEVALAVYIDVLFRKQAETALKEAKRTAEDANNSRARFLANLSHELRTPLNSIIGFSELLLQQGKRAPTEDQREEFGRQILDAGRGLFSLAKDILDYSSLSNVKPQLRYDWVPLNQLLNTALRALAVQVASTGNRMELALVEPAIEARIDYDRFRQILSNLLGNALKFTPAGGLIMVSAKATDSFGVEIAIRDSGIGIREDDLKRVLEPFVQVKNSVSEGVHGAGLGLPIAKQLVEAHRGELRVESVYGAGTTVTIILPPQSARLAPELLAIPVTDLNMQSGAELPE